ncbi:MAG: redoxin domain-containing protein [Verrucomicrobiales bacterium]|nr:redoxin domain-containing protein [Verrucomicrobiales bacterium]
MGKKEESSCVVALSGGMSAPAALRTTLCHLMARLLFWGSAAWLGLMTPLHGAEATVEAPDFVVRTWEDAAEVRRSDFAGRIVVLDFFAYWCSPCQKASAEIETGIRQHYAVASDHPRGVPVDVLSVNVESAQRARTDAFIRKHRLHRVVHDEGGRLLDALGGKNLPYVVVIDGTRAIPGQPDFRIVYRREGFEGVARIRAVVDRLGDGRPRAAVESAGDWIGSSERERIDEILGREDGPRWASIGELPVISDRPVETPSEGSLEVPTTLTTSAVFEGLFASDVMLTQSGVTVGTRRGSWEATIGGGLSTIGLDYEPAAFDFLGASSRVEEWRGAGQLAARWRFHERWTASAGAGVYDGFTDYRSAWLSEYYRQQFSGLPEYLSPTPAGHSVSAGLRWEYLPASGFAQLDYSYLSDEIAPGYEIDFDGLRRGRPYLYTHLFRLSLENIVHPRVRLLHEFRRTDTSDRDVRIGYQGSANIAVGERWVIRIQGGAAAEEPSFDAWYAGGTVECEVSSNWFLSLTGRYYEDSGEIENSNFSNAAPALQAWQVGLGLRYERDGFAVKLHAAPYATRYGPSGIGTAFFRNLYRDRDWGLLQAGIAMEF